MSGAPIVDISPSIVAGGGDATFVEAHPDGTFTVSIAHLVTTQVEAATGSGPSTSPVPAPVLGYLYGDSSGTSPDSGSCFTYGTAHGLQPPTTCPPPHWERFNTTNAYMYVEDYTSSAWPVYAAQIKWNESCCVGAYYASAGNCSFHCVPAHDANYGNTGWDGLFTYNYDSNHHFTSGSIKYNDYYTETYNQHLTDTCHEQGHALGLGHNTNTNSCLYASGFHSTVPDGDDYGELQYKIYNH